MTRAGTIAQIVSTESSLPTKIDKYEILGIIGRGGMGVVYKARDPHIDRIVAIKTIKTDADDENDQLGRLRMEARSAGKLHHPNIVTIFDFGEEGNLSYIVMEFIEGVNLSRVMQKNKMIPLATKIDVLMQITRGLAFAHECGVIHRDMKPSNVCITARGIAKILDFGLARYDDTKVTKTGYLSGTIAYMSPERFGGETGPADDIFSLGAVAYEFLTYKRAFPGDTTPEIISKILGGSTPVPVSELTGYPKALDPIIQKAMERSPTDRYRWAQDMEVSLLDFLRSKAFAEYAQQESTRPDFTKTVEWSDEASKVNLNPYSSGAKSMSSVTVSEAATVHITADESTRNPTETMKPPADPTTYNTKASVIVPPARTDFSTVEASDQDDTLRVTPKRKGLVGGLIAAGVIVAVLLGVFLTREPRSEPPPPAPAADDSALRESQLQLANAVSLAGTVSKRPLSADAKVRLEDANQKLAAAEQKITLKDYSGSLAMTAQANRTLHELLTEPSVTPPVTTTVATTTTVASPGKKPKPVQPPVVQPPVSTTVATTTTVAPTPVPVPEPRPVEPQPPVPAPRGPTRAELETEIRSFMRSIANAYQEKDVNFFRQHSLRFDEQLAGAIRNSPSKRVEIAVRDIQFSDDTRARVAVRRTDTFAEAGMPPGVQNLTYELQRTDAGWRIVTLSRQ